MKNIFSMFKKTIISKPVASVNKIYMPSAAEMMAAMKERYERENAIASSNNGTEIPEGTPSVSPEIKLYPDLLVILDPGHGATTAGKRSPAAAGTSFEYPELKVWEYQWNREMATLIAEKLETLGVTVKYTVEPNDPTDLGLTKRYKAANVIKSNHPELHSVFVSIHLNAAGSDGKWHSARGWSVWTTKGSTKSDKLADEIYLAVRELIVPQNQKMRQDLSDGDYDWEENFTVIYGAEMPAVLCENNFQDNPDDVRFILSDTGKELIANGIVNGIVNFAKKNWDL